MFSGFCVVPAPAKWTMVVPLFLMCLCFFNLAVDLLGPLPIGLLVQTSYVCLFYYASFLMNLVLLSHLVLACLLLAKECLGPLVKTHLHALRGLFYYASFLMNVEIKLLSHLVLPARLLAALRWIDVHFSPLLPALLSSSSPR